MSFDRERLYALLPAIYRLRDNELARQLQTDSGPVKALLSLIAEQIGVLEEDLEQLYDDQFIETCAEWAVHYIGDLVGSSPLYVFPNAKFTQRAMVGNMLAYRRRKGTATVLEQLARDVTGWPANVVEYFQLLATTQYMNHIRPENLAIAKISRHQNLDMVNTPFDPVTRTVDVRRIQPRRGRYNIPNVGIFLWRIDSYSLTDSPAFKIDDRRFLFDAIGKNTKLYNKPEAEKQITQLAGPLNVPMAISRNQLHNNLSSYYGKGKSVLLVVNGLEVPADKIIVCNLYDKGAGWAHDIKTKYTIDPVLGRIRLPDNLGPNPDVRVDYHYGFSAEMGGGQYGRQDSFTPDLKTVIQVPGDYPAIQLAFNQLQSNAISGTVEVADNNIYPESLHAGVPNGKTIEIRAAEHKRPLLFLSSNAVVTGGPNSELILNGFIIAGGSLTVPALWNGDKNSLKTLRLRHCTLLPASAAESIAAASPPAACMLTVEAPNVEVEVDSCILGAVRIAAGSRIRIRNSIVDSGGEHLVAYAALDGVTEGGPIEVENSTIIGLVHTSNIILASNTIFFSAFSGGADWPDPVSVKNAPVLAERLQEGCVRFSYVPPESRVPRMYQCRPHGSEEAARVRPIFNSIRYGDPEYCQLSQVCDLAITQGAEDGSEMGAFHDLYQKQRENNLQVRLDEYLRFGLEAGIFYAS